MIREPAWDQVNIDTEDEIPTCRECDCEHQPSEECDFGQCEACGMDIPDVFDYRAYDGKCEECWFVAENDNA